MKILKVKNIPVVGWSSDNPLNFRPRFRTILWLTLGLLLFGAGETLMIAANAGVSPWTVFAQGISETLKISIGMATFYTGVGVLLLWIPFKRVPGIATILNIIIIAGVIEFLLPYMPSAKTYLTMGIGAIAGILLVGLGSGFYLVANLGPGPRDGLMTGLQQLTNAPIAWVRLSIEITVTFIGWTLGGVVGVGTVLFAIGIGPAVSVGLYFVSTMSTKRIY
jgi:uncharacterized membrane protein YczE